MHSEEIVLGLREVRKAIGYTSEQLGEEVGMNPTYITRVENGTIKSPSFATVMKLAEVLSRSPQIINNEVDLSKYPGMFPRLIMVHKDQRSIVEAYSQDKAINMLKDQLDNADVLTDNEVNVFNKYAKYKKHFAVVESSIEQFMQQYKNMGYGDVENFHFVPFLKLMLSNMENSDEAQMNDALANLFSTTGIDPQTKFMETLIRQMQAFLERYEDVVLKEQNKKYLSTSEQKLLYNEES